MHKAAVTRHIEQQAALKAWLDSKIPHIAMWCTAIHLSDSNCISLSLGTVCIVFYLDDLDCNKSSLDMDGNAIHLSGSDCDDSNHNKSPLGTVGTAIHLSELDRIYLSLRCFCTAILLHGMDSNIK